MYKVLANRYVSRFAFPLHLGAAGKIDIKEGSCLCPRGRGTKRRGGDGGGRGSADPRPRSGLRERWNLPKKLSSQKAKKEQHTEGDMNHLAEISNKYRSGQKSHLESNKTDIYSAGALGEMRERFPYLYNSPCLLLKLVFLLVRCFRLSYRSFFRCNLFYSPLNLLS